MDPLMGHIVFPRPMPEEDFIWLLRAWYSQMTRQFRTSEMVARWRWACRQGQGHPMAVRRRKRGGGPPHGHGGSWLAGCWWMTDGFPLVSV
jgi:hypothetical protein